MEDRIIQLESKLNKLTTDIAQGSIKTHILNSIKSEIDDWLAGSLTVSCIKEEMERRYKRSKVELNEFNMLFQSSLNDTKTALEKVNRCYNVIQEVKDSVNDISYEMKEKADITDIHKLEKDLKEVCPISYAKLLTEEIRNNAKTSDVTEIQDEIKEMLIRIDKDYSQISGIKADIKNLKNNCSSSFDTYITKEEFLSFNSKIHKKCYESEVSVQDLNTKLLLSVDQMKDLIEQNKKMISDKVSRQTLDNITAEISEKLSKADLMKIQTDISNKIVNFQKEIAVFNRVQQEQEQILLKIDENIEEKAPKSELKLLSQKISSLSKHVDLEDKIDEIITKVNSLYEQSDEKDLQFMRMEREVSEMFAFYTRKNNESLETRFIKELVLEIKTELSQKADRSEIMKYLEHKSTYVDYASAGQAVESVHKLLKMLAVQMGTIQRSLMNNSTSRGAEKVQKEHFSKMTQRLVDYIVNSKLNQDETPLPESLKYLLKFPENLRIDFQPPPTPKTRLFTPHRKNFSSFEQ